MAYRGEHTIEEIDSAMKYKEGFPMEPFELADYTGGIQLRVEGEQDHLEDDRSMFYDTEVCPILHQLYDKGRYGRKADAGYYNYDECDEPQIAVDAGQFQHAACLYTDRQRGRQDGRERRHQRRGY